MNLNVEKIKQDLLEIEAENVDIGQELDMLLTVPKCPARDKRYVALMARLVINGDRLDQIELNVSQPSPASKSAEQAEICRRCHGACR